MAPLRQSGRLVSESLQTSLRSRATAPVGAAGEPSERCASAAVGPAVARNHKLATYGPQGPRGRASLRRGAAQLCGDRPGDPEREAQAPGSWHANGSRGRVRAHGRADRDPLTRHERTVRRELRAAATGLRAQCAGMEPADEPTTRTGASCAGASAGKSMRVPGGASKVPRERHDIKAALSLGKDPVQARGSCRRGADDQPRNSAHEPIAAMPTSEASRQRKRLRAKATRAIRWT